MACLLSNFINNLPEGTHKIKCKHGMIHTELNLKILIVIFNTKTWKIIQQNANICAAERIMKNTLMETWIIKFLIHEHFLTMMLICCCKKVFSHMNIWSMRKKSFCSHIFTGSNYWCRLKHTQKEFVKILI